MTDQDRSVDHAGRLTSALIGTAVIGAVAGACGTDSASNGDCNARIEYQGSTYRTHNLVQNAAEFDEGSLGRGDVVGCDGEPVDEVSVHRVVGVAPDVAVAVAGPEWRGVYVLEGTTPNDWPLIRRAAP